MNGPRFSALRTCTCAGQPASGRTRARAGRPARLTKRGESGQFKRWSHEEIAKRDLSSAPTGRSCSRFDLDPARQSHKSAGRRCYRGVRLRGHEIKHVHDRSSVLLLPGKNHQAITKRGRRDRLRRRCGPGRKPRARKRARRRNRRETNHRAWTRVLTLAFPQCSLRTGCARVPVRQDADRLTCRPSPL
jgi:hypothetical protein